MSNVRYGRASDVRRDVVQLIAAPSRTPLSQSCRELLYVEQAGSMVPWDPSLTPYMLEPMDCLKSRRYDSLIFCGPARTGKTVGMVDGWIMDTIARDRADMLLVQISQDKAAEYRKKRLQRGFDASPEVLAAMSPRASDNNIHDIKTRSGNWLKAGWPSKTVFASSDWRRVIITDYDRIPLDIGGEGSAFTLAGKRTQSYMSSGMVLAESSPGFMITDPAHVPATPHEAPPTLGILSLYNLGDRRLFMWQCPDCGEWYEGTFDLLQWDRNEADPSKASKDVLMACPHCGTTVREDQMIDGTPFKIHANNRGIWLPEGCQLDQNGTMTGTPRDTRSASFWQKGPSAAFQTWEQLVYKYAAALKMFNETGDFEDLKSTVNVDQGLPFFPPRSNERDPNALAARRQDLGSRVVPPWVRALIATVDVQNGAKTGRFEVQIHGVGKGLRSVIVDRFKIEKSRREDPANPGKFVRVAPGIHAEDWDLLIEKVILKSYPIDDESGRRMRVYRTACDSAGTDATTDNAYQFWRRLKKLGLHRSFMLIKGSSRAGAPLIEKRTPDNTNRSDRKVVVSGDVPLYMLNSNRVKDLASACLGREDGGPRSLAFPEWLPESFFSELVAEERDAAGKWSKVSASARNEGFDLLSYFWAVLHHLKADKIVDWDGHLPAWLADADTNAEVFYPVDEDEEEARLPVPRRRRRRSSM